MYREVIKNQRSREIQKNKKIYEKLYRGISQEYESSYKQATRQAKIQSSLKQKENNGNDSHIIIEMEEGEE